ncbi:hypothetical protein I6F07_03985 [Ensifer sp. IC4062]|nr:hypothetical protein [Ensifer sp. IC4062]
MGQAIQRACPDDRDTVQQGRVETYFLGARHIGAAKRVERDRETAGSGAGERRQDIRGHRDRNEWSATDTEHPVTPAKAGIAATTAPKPTRLATATAGRTDASAPASIVARKVGNRRKFNATTVANAAASAVTTAHTPLTAERENRAPAIIRKKPEIKRRQDQQRHAEIDKRQHRYQDWRFSLGMPAMHDFGRVEFPAPAIPT